MTVPPPQTAEERVELVRKLLLQQHNLPATNVEFVDRGNNNFTFFVDFEHAPAEHGSKVSSSQQPGTTAIPGDVRRVVVRLSNPGAGLNEDVRVQNEVAAMTLMRQALADTFPAIVPDVYSWSSASEGQGFIVQQCMSGTSLDEDFPDMSPDVQKDVLDQVASIFGAIQKFALPQSVKGYGGLQFDPEGNVVTGPTTILCGGPFTSLPAMYTQLFSKQLELSDTSPFINGWKDSGLRKRLDKLREGGFEQLVERITENRPTLIHGDLDLQNILYDKATMKITALLDFDLSHIASPLDEFFYSFASIHGILGSPFEIDKNEQQLQQYQLNGFPDDLSESGLGKAGPQSFDDEVQVNWLTAKTWDNLLGAKEIKRPRTLECGANGLQGLFWFTQEVCQPYYVIERWLRRRTPEQLEQARTGGELAIGKFLDAWGY